MFWKSVIHVKNTVVKANRKTSPAHALEEILLIFFGRNSYQLFNSWKRNGNKSQNQILCSHLRKTQNKDPRVLT